MKHGGDILSYQHLYTGELVDFSSNINPLGYPRILDQVISRGLSCLTAYPDIRYRRLRKAIADYLGCEPDEVLVGNGSMEIIDYFCQRHERVVICTPCFSEYQERAAAYQKSVVQIPLPDEDFRVSAELIEPYLTSDTALVLGNPNNPTGQRIPREELLKLQHLTAAKDVFLILDEAFFEFCPEDYDSIKLCDSRQQMCVIRAATKFFGLPGLRLGYAFAHRNIAQDYQRTALPWHVNALADLAGRVIFEEADYIQRTKTYVSEQRQFMLTELKKIPNLRVYDTDANFILLKLLCGTEDEVFNRLIRRGLLIRKASTFEGLDKSYIRIAVKDLENNRKLLKALRETFLKKH
jgi:threonine-phosphate decarboxylase